MNSQPTSEPAPRRLLTPENFAEQVSWHPESVRRALRQGRIPGAVKLGRGWRIPTTIAEQIMQNGIPGLES